MFFRLVVPPICLHLNTMQMIALDYLVAVYPLFLLVCFYLLLTAHDRGCRLVVRLWRPFLQCTARLRQHWNVRHSIIDAFATFLLLSHIKLLNTSLDLLIPTHIHNVHGQQVGKFLYYDATIEYMHGATTQALCQSCYNHSSRGNLVSSCAPVALPDAVVPKMPQQVSFEQPRSANLHAVFPRLLP